MEFELPDPIDEQKMENLTEWMKKGGADIEKVELRYYQKNHRGVHANCHIKKGEPIMFIPSDLIINYEDTISKNPLCSNIIDIVRRKDLLHDGE